LEEGIIAPGLLELHTNGLLGFHFTHFNDEEEYAGQIDKAAKFLVTQGVTGFWATIPTVSSDEYKKVGLNFFPPTFVSVYEHPRMDTIDT
jgi:N-acetylglucosamine-6-phosphate deacetylase